MIMIMMMTTIYTGEQDDFLRLKRVLQKQGLSYTQK
jgi:hypothetical protein